MGEKQKKWQWFTGLQLSAPVWTG